MVVRGVLWLVAVLALLVSFHLGTVAQAAQPQARAEPVIQVKLRDLLDLVPRRDAVEISGRLKAIEERLTAIEALMRGAPGAAPLPILGRPR